MPGAKYDEDYNGGYETHRRGKRSVNRQKGEQENWIPKFVSEHEHEEVVEKIFEELDLLKKEVSSVIAPRGTQESPAQSCRDLHLEFPAFQTGL